MRPAKAKFKAKRAVKREGLTMQRRTRENNIVLQEEGHILIRWGDGTLSSTEKSRLYPRNSPGRGTISSAHARRKARR